MNSGTHDVPGPDAYCTHTDLLAAALLAVATQLLWAWFLIRMELASGEYLR